MTIQNVTFNAKPASPAPLSVKVQVLGHKPYFGFDGFVRRDSSEALLPVVDAYTPLDERNKKQDWLQRKCLKAIAWYQRNTRHVDEQGNRKRIFVCACSPSCSTYTADAVRHHGALKGCWLGFKRIFFKCNPFYVFWQAMKQHCLPKPGFIKDPLPMTPQMLRDHMAEFIRPAKSKQTANANGYPAVAKARVPASYRSIRAQ